MSTPASKSESETANTRNSASIQQQKVSQHNQTMNSVINSYFQVMMNNGRAPHKMSDIERITNRFIIFCVLMLAAMVIVGALFGGLFLDWHHKNGKVNAPYLPSDTPAPWLEGFIGVGVFIICYQVDLFNCQRNFCTLFSTCSVV